MNTQANTHGTTGRVVSTGQSKLHNGAALQGGKEGGKEKKSSARSLCAGAWPAALARESAAEPPVTRCAARTTHEGENWER